VSETCRALIIIEIPKTCISLVTFKEFICKKIIEPAEICSLNVITVVAGSPAKIFMMSYEGLGVVTVR